jgi:hypothetical protein
MESPRRRDRFGDPGGAIDARRFRMLVQFGAAPPHVEDVWEAQLLSVGQAVLHVGVRSGGTRRSPGTRVAAILTRCS